MKRKHVLGEHVAASQSNWRPEEGTGQHLLLQNKHVCMFLAADVMLTPEAAAAMSPELHQISVTL